MVDVDRAAVGSAHPENTLDKRRLAGSIGADHGGDAGRLHPKIESVQHGEAAETLRQVGRW
jgi:hypothetical protein